MKVPNIPAGRFSTKSFTKASNSESGIGSYVRDPVGIFACALENNPLNIIEFLKLNSIY